MNKMLFLIEQMNEVIIQNQDGSYGIDNAKMNEYQLQDKVTDLKLITKIINLEAKNIDNMELQSFSIFAEITVAKVVAALILAALTWVVNQILELGLYLVCLWQGLNMYRHSIARRYNPASFLFYSLCHARGIV